VTVGGASILSFLLPSLGKASRRRTGFTPISHPRTRLNGILALAPCICLLALWLIATTFGEFRLFHFSLGRTLVEVSSTSWRAVEVAVVSNPAFVREAGYCVLPKAYPPPH
jgi:hypothetical protein